MKIILQSTISLLFLVVFSLNTLALSNYTLTGKIVDRETGDPLPGATIRVEGTKLGTMTNDKGEFEIKGIQSANISVKVTFIGYTPATRELDFGNKTKLDVTIEISSDSEQLDEIQVEAEAEGQVKAFIEQKRAENIKNVVSAEQIEQFPDLNAAEAMQRIPGITLQRDQGEGRYVQLRGTPPELTNFNINGEQIPSPEGNVRYVGMDIISADQIDFIEISKVLTPDMDADGIGGTVNIITKKAQSEIPKINATLAGGYNNLRGADNYQLQFSYGQRLGNFGFNMNASYYLNNQGSDNMEYKYVKGPFWGSQGDSVDNYYVQYREVQLRYYDITRSRTGLSGTIDYEFSENSFVYLRGMYNNFVDDETRYRKMYTLDDAITKTYYLYGGIDHDVRRRTKTQNVNTLNLGGEHDLFGIKVDYELAYAVAKEETPDEIEAMFDNPGQAIFMQFDLEDPDFPKIVYPDTSNAKFADDYENYEYDYLLFQDAKINDENLTAKINFEIPYNLNSNNKGYFKFGAKTRFKEKTRDITAMSLANYRTTSNSYPGEGPELTLGTIQSDFRETNLLGKGYLMEAMPDPDKIKEFYHYWTQFFFVDRTDSKMKSFGEDYTALEDIYAGYAMVRHDIGDLMLLGGLRFEHTDIDYTGRLINTDRGRFESMDTLSDRRTHEFLLPQFQAKYQITPNMNARGAITKTYSRPNFEDVLPYREQDREEVKYGNPDLKFPTSLNIDLLWENYYSNGGLISGGLFYKKIDDFIFYFKRFAHEGEDFSEYGLVEIEKAINGNKADVYGAEFQFQQKLNFLPGFLKDFGVYANYTFTHSEAFINKRFPANSSQAIVIFGEDDLSLYQNDSLQEEITLPGQAKHTTNLALFYDNDKFYAKISANYHDDFLYQLGADPDLDLYYDKAWHIDFTASYQVNENLNAFIDIINLNNAPLKFYLDEPEQILQQEFYSFWGRVGVKLSY